MNPPKNHAAPWTEKDERLLGTMTDRTLAAKLGRTYEAVQRQRRKLGIAPHVAHTRTFTAQELRVLHSEIKDVAKARQLGVSRVRIVQIRAKLGIAAAPAKNRA